MDRSCGNTTVTSLAARKPSSHNCRNCGRAEGVGSFAGAQKQLLVLLCGTARCVSLYLCEKQAFNCNSPMLFFRFCFICFAGLIATLAFATGKESPTQSSEKRERPVATEDSITFSSVHVDEPYIALTFDDGPSATLTPKLLDLLAAHHIKATFFVIG